MSKVMYVFCVIMYFALYYLIVCTMLVNDMQICDTFGFLQMARLRKRFKKQFETGMKRARLGKSTAFDNKMFTTILSPTLTPKLLP